MRKTKKLFIVFLLVLLVGVILLSFQIQRTALIKKRKVKWSQLRASIEYQIRHFNGQSGMVIKDLRLNWQLGHNQDKLFPSASLAKLPLMLAVFKAADEGRISLRQALRLKTAEKTGGYGPLKEMPAGSEFSVEKLIELMISESDNTAANILIELLGFEYINKCFKELGLLNTNLSRKMMAFEYRKRGIENYTDARDMAYILEKVYRGKMLNSRVSKKCLEFLKQQRVNDRIPRKLPPDIPVAHKTGLEYRTCHDAGIIFTKKGNILVCVLTRGAKNSRSAKRFISNIALQAYNYYQ